MSTGKTSVRDFLDAHPAQAEQVAVRRILGLSRQVGTRIHICHITLTSSVSLARSSGLATCEATAQHLLLNRLAFRKFGTLAICVPPIRPEPERRGLWSLFAKGQVDLLASDHAPHTLEEKNRPDAFQAASGIPGLETSLPLMFTEVSRGRLSLRRLVEATASLPARIFHLANKGALSEGFDADIVLVDPRAKLRIDPNKFVSKAKYSPFKGMRCTGKAVYTVVNGEVVAEKDEITGPPAGRTVKSS